MLYLSGWHRSIEGLYRRILCFIYLGLVYIYRTKVALMSLLWSFGMVEPIARVLADPGWTLAAGARRVITSRTPITNTNKTTTPISPTEHPVEARGSLPSCYYWYVPDILTIIPIYSRGWGCSEERSYDSVPSAWGPMFMPSLSESLLARFVESERMARRVSLTAWASWAWEV